MLRLALAFLVIALIAGVMGFGNIAAFSWDAARMLFFVFIVLAVIFFLASMLRGSPPRDVV